MTSTQHPWADELGAARVVGGKYQLVRPLGVGGMGAVWAARNASTGAQVAVKVLLEHGGNSELVERMRREAHATASLSHRGIVRVYDLIDVGTEGEQGQVAIVMELLQGRTLADHLKDHERLSEAEAAAIMLPLLSALEHAHARGVTHRDLKPENVFLSVESDGVMTPKILDFGISKVHGPLAPVITHQGQLLGTPSYMSPEQVRGSAAVDGRSDIFAMGILLYEMLSGHNPFAGDGVHPVLVAILEAEPAPLMKVTPAVWAVIERALRKQAEERFATAAEFAVALRRAVGMPCAADASGPHGALSEPTSCRAQVLSLVPAARRPKAGILAGSVGAALAGAAIAAALAVWTPSASSDDRQVLAQSAEPPAPAELEQAESVRGAPLAAPAHVAVSITAGVRAIATQDAGAAAPTAAALPPPERARPRARELGFAREPGF